MLTGKALQTFSPAENHRPASSSLLLFRWDALLDGGTIACGDSDVGGRMGRRVGGKVSKPPTRSGCGLSIHKTLVLLLISSLLYVIPTAIAQECDVEKAAGIVHVENNEALGRCVCEDGWEGPDCAVCASDEACIAAGGDDGRQACYASVLIPESAPSKTYACKLDKEKSAAVAPFLGSENIWGSCDVRGKTCTVNFAGDNATVPHVACKGANCTMDSSEGGAPTGGATTDIRCSTTKCDHGEGQPYPSSMPSFITDVLGSQSFAISIDCDAENKTSGADCSVEISGLPLPINMACRFGDCIEPTSADGDTLVQDGGAPIEEKPSFEALPKALWFLPCLVVLLLCGIGVFLVFVESKKQYLRMLYAREMRNLKAATAEDLDSETLASPGTMNSSYLPELATTTKGGASIDVNLMSELAFRDIYCDVYAAKENDGWLTQKNSLQGSLKDKVKRFRTGFSSTIQSSFSKWRTRSLGSSNSFDSKSLHSPISTHSAPSFPSAKERGPSFHKPEGVVKFAFEQDCEAPGKAAACARKETIYAHTDGDEDDLNSNSSCSDVDFESDVHDDSDVEGEGDAGGALERTRIDSRKTFAAHTPQGGASDGGSHPSGMHSKMSHFGITLQRTASRMKEALSAQLRKDRKRVLHGITGAVKKGNMLAIMGPSGCGKSTLLNILADENTHGAKIRGSVSLDENEREAWYRYITVYIAQSDELIPILTVRESIVYSCNLRLPWYYTKSRRLKRVDEVLASLNLTHVADSQVGGSCGVRGVSGGERRRVSIGMGLVTDPKIMLLDEPTSGLDSAAACSLVSTLKDLACRQGGRIVIASLHQPNDSTFKVLDLLLLLAKGRQVYFGPARKVETYFRDIGFTCPKGLNIADYMLHVVTDLDCLREIVLRAKEKREMLAEASPRSLSAKGLLASQSQGYPKDGSESPESSQRSLDNLWKVEMYRPKPKEMAVLIVRNMKQIWRRPMLLRLQIVLSIVAAILSLLIFHNMDRNIAGIQNRLGFFFFQLAFFGFAGISSTDFILEERSVYLREIHGKFYSSISYYLSKLLIDGLMLRVLPIGIFNIIVYWSLGLRSGHVHVLLYFLGTIMFSLANGALSVAVTLGSKTGGVASLSIILMLLIGILFGGFLSNIASGSAYVEWIQYLSTFYHAMGLLLSNEVRGTTFNIKSGSFKIDIPADEALEKIGLAVQPNLAIYLGGLTALYIGWSIAGYFAMKVYLSSGRVDQLWRNCVGANKKNV